MVSSKNEQPCQNQTTPNQSICQIHTLFQAKMVYTLFHIKTAQKPNPLALHFSTNMREIEALLNCRQFFPQWKPLQVSQGHVFETCTNLEV